MEESNDSKEDKGSEGQRMSAFSRITPPVARPSVFQRLSMLGGENEEQPSTSGHTRLFAFQRLSVNPKKINNVCSTTTLRASAFERLSDTTTRS